MTNIYHSVKKTYSMTNICPLSKGDLLNDSLSKGDLLNDKHMSTQ